VTVPRGLDARCGACLLYGAIEGLADGLVLIGRDGRIFHINREAARLLGVGEQRLEGTPLGAALAHTGLAALWASAAAEDDPLSADLSWPSGRTVRATASLCRSATGDPIGRALLLRDVTREKTIRVELSDAVARRLVEMGGGREPDGSIPPLTAREHEVLRLLAEGLSNAAIAARLHISVNTVASHLKHLYPKLHVSSRAQAVAFAAAHGIRPSGR